MPPGLAELVGPVALPHQSSVALTVRSSGCSARRRCRPTKLSFVAVTVLVSLAPEPTRMPVASPVSVLSVIVALPLFSTETPTR